MPEYPDLTVYLESLAPRTVGLPLERARVRGAFLLRTFDPPLEAAEGKRVLGLERLGKRIVVALEDDLFLVIHLMIAGRLRWCARGKEPRGRIELATFDFPTGTLLLTEAGTKKRASLHVLRGREALRALDPGGLEVFEADLPAFRERLTSANHTLKRALTDPRQFSGIGNAYSDEILHRARLSPVKLTQRLAEPEIESLFAATRAVLAEWTDQLRAECGGGFPEKVTAFRDGMAVHGRFGEQCPVCESEVQRIRYAESETNYCAMCQTEGKLLADRALSRLFKGDWPKTLSELEELRREQGG